VLNTLRLERQGLLEIYRPAAAQRYPAAYRSPRATWYGFAARARVLVVNHQVVPKDQWPTSIFDLADGRWKGRTAMAKPLFGTTATHAACLFAHLGSDKAKDFFRRLKTNQVQIVSGNKQVALAVATGRAAFGITDTDDAIEEVDKGQPIEIVYPDQATGQIGTLFIPNTVAVIRGCPHPESARRLVDFLLSAETEAKLALGPSAQIPLGAGVAAKPRVETAETVRAMAVDFDAAAAKWDETARFLKEEFTGD
jgi:iron(III) transport system substrate-binding protein